MLTLAAAGWAGPNWAVRKKKKAKARRWGIRSSGLAIEGSPPRTSTVAEMESGICLTGRETVDRDRVIALTRLQLGGGESGMIGRVRKVLGFQAQRGMPLIGSSAFALDRAVQKVSRVELDSWLIDQHFQHTPAARIIDFGCFPELPVGVEDPVVIIAVTQADLFIIGVDSLSHCRRPPKIKRSRGYGLQFSRRNQTGVNRRKAGRVQGQLMLQNVTLPREIEIGVI